MVSYFWNRTLNLKRTKNSFCFGITQTVEHLNDLFVLLFFFVDQTTLNPVPQLGTYSWRQNATNNGTLAIVVNVGMSLELPYTERSVIVTLGSETQQQEFVKPSESIEFEFGGLELISKDYPLMINFSLIDPSIDHLFTATNVVNGTVTTIAPSTTNIVNGTVTTIPPSMANKQFAWHSLLLVLFSVRFFLM